MSELNPFDPVKGPARESVDLLSSAIDPRVIAEDFRRRRARYFDGRFLTARDLTREQQYALIRQADLGQAGGGGVVLGLRVQRISDARTLRISAGNGLTPAGEMVRLPKTVIIKARDIPAIERLDATFGLAKLPGEPTGTRTGLFVLALRPVEFTDNPTISYPVGLDDKRRLEEGEIVEASAIILIPFEQAEPSQLNDESRAQIARAIFFQRGLRRLSSEALPLAVVALNRGNIVWVDEFLVRRNVGSTEVLSFGLGERAVREAFFQQYSAHLKSIELNRATQGLGDPFAATEFFSVLPPFGPLPLGSVEVQGDKILQSFFPADVNVELTILSSDELPALAEESLAFPPFDLTESSETLELTAVMLCIPMEPEQFATKLTEFEGQVATPDQRRLVRPTTRVLPIEALDVLRRQRVLPSPVVVAPVDLAPWEEALKAVNRLYYVRRRQLTQVAPVVPRFPEIGPNDPTSPTQSPVLWDSGARARLVLAGELDTGFLTRFDFLMRRTTDDVVARLDDFFARPPFNPANLEGRLLINAAIAELAYRARTRLEDVVRAEAFPERTRAGGVPPIPARRAGVRVRALRIEDVIALENAYPQNDATFGTGLRSLLGVVDPGPPVVNVGEQLNQLGSRSVLAASLRVRELDSRARTSSDLLQLAKDLLRFVRAGDLNGIWALAAGLPAPS